jgi:molybdopterin-guanine dinucleotide biosynthesis protein A
MTGSAATDTLGAIIAGGASTRFGSPKALAEIGGVRAIDRVAAALHAALMHGDIIAIVNDPEIARVLDMPHRADERPGAGALSGLHTALLEARARGRRGILAAGCDMPFLSPSLLRLLLESDTADAVLPESEGPRGVEPLCAWYGVSCIAAIETALDRGDARMIGFHRDIAVRRIPLEIVRAHGDSALLFMNLNTPADLQTAQEHARDENA